MKRLNLLFVCLFLVFGVNMAQEYGYHAIDYDCILKFMCTNAVDKNGRIKETNAHLLLGDSYTDDWHTNTNWLKYLQNKKWLIWDNVEEEGVISKRMVRICFSGAVNMQLGKYLSGELNFKDCKFLDHIQCCDEKITAVNLDGCENLKTVLLENNIIRRANFENCNNIQKMHLNNNELSPSAIKLTQMPETEFLFYGQKAAQFDYTIALEFGELYMKVDLSDQLNNVFLSENFKMRFRDIQGVKPEITDDHGIFYYKVDDLLNSNYTVQISIMYQGINDKLFCGDVEFETDIFNTLWQINITTNPMPSGTALACIYWVEDDKFYLIDKAKNYGQSFINTRFLPPGEYIVLVDAAGYLCAYYSDSDDSPVRSWKDERIKKVSPGDKIKISLEKKPELTNEGISIEGMLEEASKTITKATARVLQRSTVTLQSKSTAQKSTGEEWIWVATTQTDDDGNYEFLNLPRNTYRVIVEMPGFEASQPIIVLADTEGAIHGNQNFIVNEADKFIAANGDFVSSYLSNEEIHLSVYPNPVTDMVRIEGLEGACTVKIFNMTGQIVKSVMGSSPEMTLYLNDLSSGMYLLRIESQGRARTVKLVKN